MDAGPLYEMNVVRRIFKSRGVSMRHAAGGVKLDETISWKVRALVELGRIQPRDLHLICRAKRAITDCEPPHDRVLASIDFFARAYAPMTDACWTKILASERFDHQP
jgi:hypothetical protein